MKTIVAKAEKKGDEDEESNMKVEEEDVDDNTFLRSILNPLDLSFSRAKLKQHYIRR